MYRTFYNEITGKFETLSDRDLEDMILKRVMDSRRMQRVRDGTSQLCVLCGKEFLERGNNPWPLREDGVCCDECNSTKVIPARMKHL